MDSAFSSATSSFIASLRQPYNLQKRSNLDKSNLSNVFIEKRPVKYSALDHDTTKPVQFKYTQKSSLQRHRNSSQGRGIQMSHQTPNTVAGSIPTRSNNINISSHNSNVKMKNRLRRLDLGDVFAIGHDLAGSDSQGSIIGMDEMNNFNTDFHPEKEICNEVGDIINDWRIKYQAFINRQSDFFKNPQYHSLLEEPSTQPNQSLIQKWLSLSLEDSVFNSDESNNLSNSLDDECDVSAVNTDIYQSKHAHKFENPNNIISYIHSSHNAKVTSTGKTDANHESPHIYDKKQLSNNLLENNTNQEPIPSNAPSTQITNHYPQTYSSFQNISSTISLHNPNQNSREPVVEPIGIANQIPMIQCHCIEYEKPTCDIDTNVDTHRSSQQKDNHTSQSPIPKEVTSQIIQTPTMNNHQRKKKNPKNRNRSRNFAPNQQLSTANSQCVSHAMPQTGPCIQCWETLKSAIALCGTIQSMTDKLEKNPKPVQVKKKNKLIETPDSWPQDSHLNLNDENPQKLCDPIQSNHNPLSSNCEYPNLFAASPRKMTLENILVDRNDKDRDIRSHSISQTNCTVSPYKIANPNEWDASMHNEHIGMHCQKVDGFNNHNITILNPQQRGPSEDSHDSIQLAERIISGDNQNYPCGVTINWGKPLLFNKQEFDDHIKSIPQIDELLAIGLQSCQKQLQIMARW